MAAKPYTPVSWSDNEAMIMEKLNSMTNNDQYLFENSPTVYYNGHGVKKTAGTKILTAAVSVAPTTLTWGTKTFYFGDFFSSGCRPLVIAGLNSSPQSRLSASVRGIGTYWPDHRGFDVIVTTTDMARISATVWVPFIAVGW